VQPFVRGVPHVAEVSIGFAVISRAVFSGLPQAVRDMRHLIHTA